MLIPEQILKRDFTFLHRALSNAAFKRIVRQLLASLESLLYREVLLRQDFSIIGAARFLQDVTAIQGVIDQFSSRSGSPLGMPKLREAAVLMNLPLEAHEGRVPLRDTYTEITTSTSAAKEALEHLGMSHLTNREAQVVLERRLEIGSN